MSEAAKAIAPADKIVPALVHHYTAPEPGGAVLETAQLISLLNKLPSLSSDEHADTIVQLIQKHEAGASIEKDDYAVIAFVDDAITEVLNQTDLDFRLEQFIRDVAPMIAVVALEADINEITVEQTVFELVDLLINECIGWSEDLGFLGEQYMEKITAPMSSLTSGRSSIPECIKELKEYFKKEEPLFKKLEQRLLDRELKSLSGKKAQFFATELLNKEMTGQQLPLFIIFMLQGPWFEFVQQVYVECGEKSKEWDNVQKLTEALIWSLQPGKDAAKKTSIMDTLPDRVRDFAGKMTFDTEQLVASLADLEGEYEAHRANEPSDPCDFELLETDEAMASAMQAASAKAVEEIKEIPVDQWFLYDDTNEPDEKVARIKLILNWTETEQLLLTNHNRRKVVHMSYGEMINHLGSGVVRKLNPKQSTAETFKSHLRSVLQNVSDQNKKEKQIEVQEERKAVSEEYVAERKEDLVKQLQVLEERAKRKKQRALVLRHKAQKKQEMAEETLNNLKQDAWVSLPIMEGTLTPCKLVAIIPAADKYIFANRAGLKVAEYTGSQLAHMIVTENSEILDTGAEFESALATVVSGLREDKNKSYEELTGDSS